jgi:phosphate transport system substrate-binding protein
MLNKKIYSLLIIIFLFSSINPLLSQDLYDYSAYTDDEDFYNSFEDILAAIAGGIYPSPPARELYFVSKGKPKKQATLNFIEWVLTSGQAYVNPAGYVPIDQSRINAYLEKTR